MLDKRPVFLPMFMSDFAIKRCHIIILNKTGGCEPNLDGVAAWRPSWSLDLIFCGATRISLDLLPPTSISWGGIT